MTQRQRIPYRAPRTCCDAEGDVKRKFSETNDVTARNRDVWVFCKGCGKVRKMERDTQ